MPILWKSLKYPDNVRLRPGMFLVVRKRLAFGAAGRKSSLTILWMTSEWSWKQDYLLLQLEEETVYRS